MNYFRQVNFVPLAVTPVATLPFLVTGYVPPYANPDRWMYAVLPPL